MQCQLRTHVSWPRCAWGDEVVSSPATFINVALLTAQRRADRAVWARMLRVIRRSNAQALTVASFTLFKSGEAPADFGNTSRSARCGAIDVSVASHADEPLPLTCTRSISRQLRRALQLQRWQSVGRARDRHIADANLATALRLVATASARDSCRSRTIVAASGPQTTSLRSMMDPLRRWSNRRPI